MRTLAPATASSPAPVRATLRVLVRLTAGWVLGISAPVIAGFAVIGVAVNTTGHGSTYISTASIWAVQWIAFAGGIGLGTSGPVLIAHGITRRHAFLASAGTVAVLALGLAVLVHVGTLAEALVHRLLGNSPAVDDSHLFATLGEVHLALAEYTLVFAAFLATGWLVTTVYYRFGARWGTLFLPLSALPMVAAAGALSLGWRGPLGDDALPWAGAAARRSRCCSRWPPTWPPC